MKHRTPDEKRIARNLAMRTYRRKNAARANERSRKWREDNPEKARALREAWAAANPRRVKELAKRCHLKKHYGLTPEMLTQKIREQDGLCAICFTPGGTKLVVDHCHDSGEIRALLCRTCNMAIGLMKEDPKHLISAASYLHKHMGLKLKSLIG